MWEQKRGGGKAGVNVRYEARARIKELTRKKAPEGKGVLRV